MNNKRLRKLNEELGINDLSDAPNIRNIQEMVVRKMHREQTYEKIFKKKKAVSLIAAVVMMISIASFSVLAGSMGWHGKLIEYFNNPKEEDIKQMSANTLYPVVTETDNDVTVNVLQTIADNHGIYVLYEVQVPEDISPDETLYWDRQQLNVKYEKADRIVGKGGYAYNEILSVEKDKCTMLYIRTGTGKIQSQELSFELSGLYKTEKMDKAFVKASYNCNFRLVWGFEHENSGKEWDVNYKLNNYEAYLRKIELSPVSVWLTINGEVLDLQEGVAVNLEDGNRIIINNEECNVSYTPLYGGINTISAEFDRLIIVDDVESIEIGGQKFNVNGE